jgi:hypothetical protein
MFLRNVGSYKRLTVSHPRRWHSFLLQLLMEVPHNLILVEEWCLLGCYAVWFLQEPHGVTTQ